MWNLERGLLRCEETLGEQEATASSVLPSPPAQGQLSTGLLPQRELQAEPPETPDTDVVSKDTGPSRAERQTAARSVRLTMGTVGRRKTEGACIPALLSLNAAVFQLRMFSFDSMIFFFF